MQISNALVVKVGGALLESTAHLTALLELLAKLTKQRPVALVHGGGAMVQEWLTSMEKPSHKIDGLRVTPEDQMPFVAGALAGAANKQIVAKCKALNIDAAGVSLADGDIALSQITRPELGCVGEAQQPGSRLLCAMLNNGFMPIVSSIGCNDVGQLLNVNADQAAVAVAQALQAELLLLSDVPGVLDAKGELIAELSAAQIDELIEQNVIRDGMAVKVRAALKTANELAQPVIIAGWKTPEKLIGLLGEAPVGTRIVPTTIKAGE